ncbi:hypothetical protein DFR49_4218 [Hephaestia caeni]|uniref:Uncharacterized protein n=1 Tax=Hephaestia caeni TaxID=645617 RepID=A0A397NPR7_9SPHN|nr:hypothetical protein [Hephaestia caeni]RIA35441.1 hypothetical protein DFR49_4218 [Hephaestia caeni]
MKQTIAWVTLIALATVLIGASICQPYYLTDDGNSFFKGFVTWELLSFLGVVVTITLASAANLHLELNKLEEKTDERFPEARNSIRLSAYSLLMLFLAAFVLVVVKPTIDGAHWNAVLNSVAVLIVLFNLAILADLTMAVFRIPPLKDKAK